MDVKLKTSKRGGFDLLPVNTRKTPPLRVCVKMVGSGNKPTKRNK